MSKWINSSIATLLMGFSVSVWAGNPCMPIAEACMKAGYYKGGQNVGKGLIVDCVAPITAKSKTLPNVSFSDETLKQCAAMIANKM